MRYQEIDIIKGVCMLLVFVQHSILYYPIDFSELYPTCNLMSSVIGSFFMPCFFVVSGFLYFGGKKGWSVTMKDKVMRLLVPYVAVCAIQFAVKLVVPSLAFGCFNSLREYANYYLLAGGDRWFLYVLFLVFLFWAPFKKWIVRPYIYLPILIVLYYISLRGLLPFFFPMTKLLHFSIYFFWGFVLKNVYQRVRPLLSQMWWVLGIAFALANVVFLRELPFMVRGVCCPLIGTAFMFAITNWLQERGWSIVDKWHQVAAYVGRYSLQFYVMTGFVLSPARIIMVNILHQTNPWIVIPGVLCIQLLFATIGVKVCEKWKVTRWAFGY